MGVHTATRLASGATPGSSRKHRSRNAWRAAAVECGRHLPLVREAFSERLLEPRPIDQITVQVGQRVSELVPHDIGERYSASAEDPISPAKEDERDSDGCILVVPTMPFAAECSQDTNLAESVGAETAVIEVPDGSSVCALQLRL